MLKLQPRYKLSEDQLSITGFQIRKGLSIYAIESVNLTYSLKNREPSVYSYHSIHTGYGTKKKALVEFTKWWSYVGSQPYKSVMTYLTKHDLGFIDEEIEELCDMLKVSRESFSKKFGAHTCAVIDNKTIMYHSDVLRTFKLVLRDRELRMNEFD